MLSLRLKFFIKIVFSLILLSVLFYKINFYDLSAVLSKIDYKYFIPAFAFFLIGWLVNSKKWQVFLDKIGFEIRYFDLFKLNIVSIFYATVLPGGQLTGEVAKSYKFIKGNQNKIALLSSVLLDKIFQIYGIAIVGFLSLLFTRSDFPGRVELLATFAAVFVLLTIMGVFSGNIKFFIDGLFSLKVVKKFFGPSQENARLCLVDVEKILTSRGIFVKAIFYSIIFQLFNTACIYYLALSLSLNIGYVDLLWINAAVSVALFIPLTFMGFGIREGSFVLLLGLLSVSNAHAISLSFLCFFIMLLAAILGGYFELVGLFKKNSAYVKDT